MDTLLKLLKSRTVWTVVVMFVIGGTTAVNSVIPDSAKPVVEFLLGLLATYFKLNPSQNYDKA